MFKVFFKQLWMADPKLSIRLIKINPKLILNDFCAMFLSFNQLISERCLILLSQPFFSCVCHYVPVNITVIGEDDDGTLKTKDSNNSLFDIGKETVFLSFFKNVCLPLVQKRCHLLPNFSIFAQLIYNMDLLLN